MRTANLKFIRPDFLDLETQMRRFLNLIQHRLAERRRPPSIIKKVLKHVAIEAKQPTDERLWRVHMVGLGPIQFVGAFLAYGLGRPPGACGGGASRPRVWFCSRRSGCSGLGTLFFVVSGGYGLVIFVRTESRTGHLGIPPSFATT